jgi:MFS family permease
VLVLRAAPARQLMMLGMGTLLAGVGVTVAAITAGSATVFLIGTAVAGVGFGAGFQGAIRTVLPLAAAHERAGVLSTMFVVSYLALGLPAVIAGYVVVHGGGLLASAREYAVAVMILAALAILALARRPRRAPATAERAVGGGRGASAGTRSGVPAREFAPAAKPGLPVPCGAATADC